MNDGVVERLSVFFGDIHFYFITGTHIYKCLLKLETLVENNVSLNIIIKKNRLFLEKIKILRDHQEHILDGRLQGKGRGGEPLTEPGMLGNVFDGEYNFGGDKINLIESFDRFEKLRSELIAWQKQTRPRDDTNSSP